MSRSTPLSGVLPSCAPSVGGLVSSTLFVQLLSTHCRMLLTFGVLPGVGEVHVLSTSMGTRTLAPRRVVGSATLSMGPHRPHCPVVTPSALKQLGMHAGLGVPEVLP